VFVPAEKIKGAPAPAGVEGNDHRQAGAGAPTPIEKYPVLRKIADAVEDSGDVRPQLPLRD
jgi:hypothetical protein